MAAVNSRFNSALNTKNQSSGTGTKANGVIPNIVDYAAFASSGTTLAIANKPPILGDRTIQLPNIPSDVDWNLMTNQGATLSIRNKPVLSTVATTGAYPDLINAPALAAVAKSGAYSDLVNKPNLATVATTGSYTDLINQPTIPVLPSNIVQTSAGVQTQTVPLLNGQLFTGTWGTPTYRTMTSSYSTDIIQYPTFYQSFYNNQTGLPVTLPAGYFTVNVPAQGAWRMCGWDFVDGSRYLSDVTDFNKSVIVSGSKYGGQQNVSNGFGSGNNCDQTNAACQPYPGFARNAYSSPLFAGQNLYVSGATNTLTLTSASVTLPAGVSEFRMAVWCGAFASPDAGYTPFTISNFFSMSPAYSIADGSIPAVQSLIVKSPRTWLYYFNQTAINGPQSTYTPASSTWTLVSPSGTATIMSASDGTFKIPQTGIYAITLSTSWGGGGGAFGNHRMVSNDTALGVLANQMMFGETLDISKVDQLDTSMTTRIAGGSVLTPVFNFNGILYGSGTSANALTRVVITLLYACA